MTDPYQPSYQDQPASYGQSYPGSSPAVAEHPRATTVLVLGIVGIFVPIVSFVAWFVGTKTMNEIRSSGIAYSNEQSANIGRILGMVWSILQILGIVFSIIVAVIFAVIGSSN